MAFSAIIAPEDAHYFRRTNPRPEKLGGHMVRLRGFVQIYGGRPEIFLSNPAQIELVE
jgi:DNA/RNA endonuclease YhcR with UshA esterase domain